MPDKNFNPTKLHSLIVELVRRLDRELGSIELAKLVYLADIERLRLTGETITEQVYIRREFGPLARDFQDAIRSMLGHELNRRIGLSSGWSGIRKYCHTVGEAPRFEPILSSIDIAIVRRIVRKYGGLSPIGLEQEAYDTEPMQADGLESGQVLDLGLAESDARVERWRRNKELEKPAEDTEYLAHLETERAENEALISSL